MPAKRPPSMRVEPVGDRRRHRRPRSRLHGRDRRCRLRPGCAPGASCALARLPARAARRFARLLVVEDRPVVGPKRGRGVRLGLRRSATRWPRWPIFMPARCVARAQAMSTATASPMPPRCDGPAEGAVAAHLLGHGEDLEAVAVRLASMRARIRFDRVEIDARRSWPGARRPGAARSPPRSRRGLRRRRTSRNIVPPPLSGAFRAATAATAARMMRPRTIICSETERPIRIRPLFSMPISSEPTSAPTIVPSPPLSRVPPTMTAAITVSRSVSPSV